MTVYGYARVSTEGQDLTPQLVALLPTGCAEIVEKASHLPLRSAAIPTVTGAASST